MAYTPVGTNPAFNSALPVQVPGQQLGSIRRLPSSVQPFSQADVINAARKYVQGLGPAPNTGLTNPLYTADGISNGYQEGTVLPAGRPKLGPNNTSSTARSVIQGFAFKPLTNPSVFGGSISDNTPPPPGNTYITSR
jgi:hypothetical protein